MATAGGSSTKTPRDPADDALARDGDGRRAQRKAAALHRAARLVEAELFKPSRLAAMKTANALRGLEILRKVEKHYLEKSQNPHPIVIATTAQEILLSGPPYDPLADRSRVARHRRSEQSSSGLREERGGPDGGLASFEKSSKRLSPSARVEHEKVAHSKDRWDVTVDGDELEIVDEISPPPRRSRLKFRPIRAAVKDTGDEVNREEPTMPRRENGGRTRRKR